MAGSFGHGSAEHFGASLEHVFEFFDNNWPGPLGIEAQSILGLPLNVCLSF